MIEHERVMTATPIDDDIGRSGSHWEHASKKGGIASTLLRDVSPANVAAGVNAGLWYAFGAIPLFLGVAAQLRMAPEVAAQWFFAIFATATISSIALSILYRQPLAIGWTIPGLVFIATAGGRFAFQEVMGACLAAGLIVTALGLLGASERLTRWVPLPIVMGMFAGSSLGYVSGVFGQLESQPVVTGASLLAYVACWALRRAWLPPIGGAVLSGLLAALCTGQIHPEALRWGMPVITPVTPAFSLESLLTLTLPLVVMIVGLGNVQGIGFLLSEGYRPPIRLLTVVVGLSSVLNALLGGHPSTMQRVGTAMVAGRDAGSIESRYVAALIASVWGLLLAFTATAAQSLTNVLPMGVVAAFAGLAILSPLMDSLRRAVAAEKSAGAFVSFAVSTSSVTILGLDSAFWALAAGWLVFRMLDQPTSQSESLLRGSSPSVGSPDATVAPRPANGARQRTALKT